MRAAPLVFLLLATCNVPDEKYEGLPDSAPPDGVGSGAQVRVEAETNHLDVPSRATVRLTPTAQPGSRFAGWAGDCSGTGSCELVMDRPHVVIARFALADQDAPAADAADKLARDDAPTGGMQTLAVETLGLGRVTATVVAAPQ